MGSAPTVSVTCPPGFAPGAAFVVQDPSTGQQMQVVVPDGIMPGQTFQVQVPLSVPAPVPMAQPYVEQQYAPYAPQPVAPQQVNINMMQPLPQAPIIINNNNNATTTTSTRCRHQRHNRCTRMSPARSGSPVSLSVATTSPSVRRAQLQPTQKSSLPPCARARAHPRPKDCVACHCPLSCRIVMSPPLSVQVSASRASSPVPTGCSSTCT